MRKLALVSLSEKLLLDPGFVLRDLDIDAGDISFTAADAPRDDSGKLPKAVDFADERAAAVAGASVLAFLATSAEESGVEDKVGTESGPSEQVLALAVVDDRNFDLLEDLLVRSLREGVLAPAGGHAALAGKLDVPVRQADWADVRVSRVVDVAVDSDERDVVEEVARVVLVVDEDFDGVDLDVGVELGVVVHVPFSNANPEHKQSFSE